MTNRIVGKKCFFLADFFHNGEGKSESFYLTVSYRDVKGWLMRSTICALAH